MRRDDRRWHVKERVVWVSWLFFENIESSTSNFAILKSFDHVSLIVDRTPTGIDEDGGLLHDPKLA